MIHLLLCIEKKITKKNNQDVLATRIRLRLWIASDEKKMRWVRFPSLSKKKPEFDPGSE